MEKGLAINYIFFSSCICRTALTTNIFFLNDAQWKTAVKKSFWICRHNKTANVIFFYLNSTAQAIICLPCAADSQKCKNDRFSIGHRGVEVNECHMPKPGINWNICSYRAGGYGNQRGHPYVDEGQMWTNHIDDRYIQHGKWRKPLL